MCAYKRFIRLFLSFFLLMRETLKVMFDFIAARWDSILERSIVLHGLMSIVPFTMPGH